MIKRGNRFRIEHNKKIFMWIIILLIILTGIIYLIRQQNKVSEEEKENQQLPNPASVYCIEQGGNLEIRENEAGQYGVCIMNEEECEEWAFYRGECSLG